MLRWSLEQDRPTAIRYARGGIMYGEPLGTCSEIKLGTSEVVREGGDVALIALGHLVYAALKVAEVLAQSGIQATVVNARFVKPLDEAMVREVTARTGRIVTLEESSVLGGFGSAVSEAMDRLGVSHVPQLRIGLPDQFIEHGKRTELLLRYGFDADSLTQRISQWYHKTTTTSTTTGELPLVVEPTE